jgi:hypothetical protein
VVVPWGGVAGARREQRAGPTHRYGPADVAMFQPHVLLELDGLRAGIDRLPDPRERGALDLVLSAILTKLSRRASDTSAEVVEKRIAAGYPAKLFVRKTEELVARLAEIAPALSIPEAPDAPPPARVLEGDARVLDGVLAGSIALAITSPPYPGNYDYLAQHAARLRWLRLPDAGFDRAEIGARRHLDPLGPAEGAARWCDEIGAALRALRWALSEDGAAVMLLADSVVAGVPVYAMDLLASEAPAAGLAFQAAVSQARPHFHAGSAQAFAARPRREHAILLVPDGPPPHEPPSLREQGRRDGGPAREPEGRVTNRRRP